MLIVIGLLVIITTVAVPKFKKCYDDIHLNKALDDLDALLQSTRSYYLVMNESPGDGNPGLFPVEAGWVLQANFLGSKKTENEKDYYNFAIKPWKGHLYDWDCWADESYHSAEWVLLFAGKSEQTQADRDLFKKKVAQRYGKDLINYDTKRNNKDYTYLNISLVETPKTGKETNYWNRYY